ncbi:hypothetical protein BDR06DRAFT_954427 [Suillus hirtellus]|nr:hypothetical protein BDR06DRAFT_954427 [Suillus hirtellus]
MTVPSLRLQKHLGWPSQRLANAKHRFAKGSLSDSSQPSSSTRSTSSNTTPPPSTIFECRTISRVGTPTIRKSQFNSN